jgi:hypothetical protein
VVVAVVSLLVDLARTVDAGVIGLSSTVAVFSMTLGSSAPLGDLATIVVE